MQQVQQAYYGHATPVTVEGVPEYPSSMTGKRRVAPGPANVTRMDAPTGAWKKPLSITAVVVAALTAVVLTFVFVVMPHMDDTATRNRTSVSTPAPPATPTERTAIPTTSREPKWCRRPKT